MSEEHGYQRSGKKCREKFDNLYKYYKKTKDGNARKRHGGKHYRFFRQLEALYGDQTTNSASLLETPSLVFGSFHYNHPTNNVSSAYDHQDSYHCPKISETTTPSNSCESDSTSSDESDPNIGMESNDPRRKKRRGLKAKIRESIGAQMKKLMDKQEAWMEKMMNAIEHKERERMVREEQWRKQDEARIEMQHKLWASERAWMEARDAAIMDAFRNLTGRETTARASSGQRILREKTGNDIWQDCEITRMIELRSEMGLRSQQGGISEEAMWDEIAAGMARFGHHRTALMCRDKWDSVNDYLIKKRMENESSVCNEGGLVIPYCESSEAGIGDAIVRLNNHHGDSINDHSCFRYSFGL